MYEVFSGGRWNPFNIPKGFLKSFISLKELGFYLIIYWRDIESF